MPALVKPPRLGRHWTACTVIGQTVSGAGSLSTGSSQAVTLVVKADELRLMAEKADINAVNSTRKNNVVIDDDLSYSLSVYTINNGSDPDPLMTLIGSYDVFKITYVKGTVAGSIETTSFYCSRAEYSTGTQGKGEQIGTLTFDGVDAGSDSYSRALT